MPIRGQSFDIQPSIVQTTNGVSNSIGLDMFNEIDVFLKITTVSGTTPSLTVKLQTSPDGGSTWYDVTNGAFPAQTATGQVELTATAGFGNLVRAAWTITGTTPSFTFYISAEGK